MVWFPRCDDKTGKSLMEGVKTVSGYKRKYRPLSVIEAYCSFLWDIGKDNPAAGGFMKVSSCPA
ncbi:hypothetical protein MASR1M66_01980 [Aminivibrio sp.]